MFKNCIICGSKNLEKFLFQEVVAASVSPQRNSKQDLTGTLDIVRCNSCSHIFNQSVDPEIIAKIYAQEYSASLPVSETIKRRFRDIVKNIVGKGGLSSKVVCEIGASDFTFCEMLLEAEASRVIAFEPSLCFHTTNPKITHVQDYLKQEYIDKYFSKIDLIVIRHVVEHLIDPMAILETFGKNMKVGSKLYIEVPDVNDVIEKKRVYDFFYDHVSYFNPELLQRILVSFGYKILQVSHLVDGQHFGVLAEKINDANANKAKTLNLKTNKNVDLEPFKKTVSEFENKVSKIISDFDNVAIYGAGAHAVTTTVRLACTPKQIRYLLDLSPIKNGALSPVCKIPIVQPSVEKIKDLDCIIIVASLHQNEVHSDLRNKWKFSGKIFGTYPEITELS